MLRFSLKAAAEPVILGRDAHRTGVLGTDPHHHAAHADQGSRGKAVLLRAQKRRDGHIPSAHELAVRLQDDPAAESVLHKTAVGFGQAQLPGKTRVVDGTAGGGTGSAVITGDEDDLSARLGDAGGDGTDAGLGDQLDVDPGIPVGVFQVIDQLGQVFDGVNIVVGRRGDQGDAGRRKTGRRHPGVDLFAGQVAALAGLGALGHFDLDLIGAAQIGAGHAKAPRGHLLDPAVGVRAEPLRRFASLTGVGLCPNGIHGPRQGLMGLPGEGAEAHGTGLEMLHDRLDGLHPVQRNRGTCRNKFQQATQSMGVSGVIHQLCVLLEPLEGIRAHGLLQGDDGLGTVEMVFTALSPAQGMETD